METLKLYLAILFMILVIFGSLVWAVVQWFECRNMDFSVLYCLKHIL